MDVRISWCSVQTAKTSDSGTPNPWPRGPLAGAIKEAKVEYLGSIGASPTLPALHLLF